MAKALMLSLCVSLFSAGFNASNGCQSGGPGSSSCSASTTVGPVTTSVSVTCNAGYYSCCNPGGASCKADGGGNIE